MNQCERTRAARRVRSSRELNSLVSSRGNEGGGSSTVGAENGTPDPTGEGRIRYIEIKSVFGPIITGSVGWQADDATTRSKGEIADWDELIDDMEMGNDRAGVDSGEDNTMDGWRAVEELAVDSFDDLPVEAVRHSEEVDQQRERGSSISLVTSGAKNTLYFA